MVAVNIFLLLIVKGTKCCLNCLIIRQIKNWPNPETIDIANMSIVNETCYHIKTTKLQPFKVTIAITKTNREHHLLISAII